MDSDDNDNMNDPIKFKATFPTIQSAIKVSGTGDGMRIQLDIPESEMPQAIQLLAMRQVVLQVTMKPIENEQKQHDNNRKIHI